MTEAEALKRFIPILGRISTPGDRVTITRNILERIAGRQTSIMGVSHKHAGALAWPNDDVNALAFEHALDIAVDAGEFVSLLHRADRRLFQIEELSAWPNCPKIDAESPLTFWLSDAVQTATTPAPVGADGPRKPHSNKSEQTLIFEAKVLELMGKFWNERPPNTRPAKGELCKAVYAEMLRGTIRGQRTLTDGMVRDAAKPWKYPIVLPAFVPDSKFNDKRHPFKGEK